MVWHWTVRVRALFGVKSVESRATGYPIQRPYYSLYHQQGYAVFTFHTF
jgi:hypothetical protein